MEFNQIAIYCSGTTGCKKDIKMTSKPSQTGSLAKKKEKEENILLAEEKNRETKYFGGEVYFIDHHDHHREKGKE